MMKKILFAFVAIYILSGFTPSVTRKISGKITDGTHPIPGALIKTNVSARNTTSDQKGLFEIELTAQDTQIEIKCIGFTAQQIKINKQKNILIVMTPDNQSLSEIVVIGYATQKKEALMASNNIAGVLQGRAAGFSISNKSFISKKPINNESYAKTNENSFHQVKHEPLSTFSVDVDRASYSNIRRLINNGQLPPADAVRVEEIINYFDYDYAQPSGKDPVNIITEMGPAPWNPNHKLVHIGLKAKKLSAEHLPASNLVFLIDVSGSMSDPNKLPLLVASFKLLTDQLRPQDRVAIVVYAGNSGLVLPSTSGKDKTRIKDALDQLNAGGSTAGGEGIELAYKVAAENFIKNGNNRVILATDGDFNVGASSDSEMEKLIEAKRTSGIFLTVLGYGMGNYKDSKMEILADKGNGNYAYIDNITEARKVLINEFGGTLFTVAKDVKLQVEFNPAQVKAYRLIGYENRMLNHEDFNNDQKDAGEMGSGHTVTALYEIVPAGTKDDFSDKVDELKYQKISPVVGNTEVLTVKLRYKDPAGSESLLLSRSLVDQNQSLAASSDHFRFSAAVAAFGMLLKQSAFKQQASFDQVIALAGQAKGKDEQGFRAEFINLAKSARLMAKNLLTLR